MLWFTDKSQWHFFHAYSRKKLPEIGIDGVPLFNSPEQTTCMRRIINGQKQYRAATPAELREDLEDWADGFF